MLTWSLHHSCISIFITSAEILSLFFKIMLKISLPKNANSENSFDNDYAFKHFMVTFFLQISWALDI